MATIDPRVLEAYLAGQDIGQFGFMTQEYQPGYWQGGESGSWVNDGPMQTHLIRELDKNNAEVYDDKGNFLGLNSGASDGQALTNFVLSALALYGAGQGLGALGGAEGGIGSGITATSAEAAVPAATWGEVSATLPSLGGAGAGVGTAGAGAGAVGAAAGGGGGAAGGASGAGGALGTTGLSEFRQGEIASYGTNGSMPSSAAVDYGDRSGGLLDWFGRNFGRIASGLAGAASSGDEDQTATQQKEPWGPAQGFLKDLIGDAGQLRNYYQQNPFNAMQQQYAGQKAGLLDGLTNQVMPGLLSGLGQMSQGYQRQGGPAPRASGMNYNPAGLMAAMQGGGGIDWTKLNPYARAGG